MHIVTRYKIQMKKSRLIDRAEISIMFFIQSKLRVSETKIVSLPLNLELKNASSDFLLAVCPNLRRFVLRNVFQERFPSVNRCKLIIAIHHASFIVKIF